MSLGLAQLLSFQSLPMLRDPSSAGELKPFAGLGRVVKRFPFFWGGHISTAIIHTIPVFLDGRIYWTSKISIAILAILPALQFLVPGSSTGALVRRANLSAPVTFRGSNERRRSSRRRSSWMGLPWWIALRQKVSDGHTPTISDVGTVFINIYII